MANQRFSAVRKAGKRQPLFPEFPSNKVSDYYGSTCFNHAKMEETLAPDVYKEVKYCIDKGKKIGADSANAVAAAVKSWAIDNGITHYTHWFQPLTGSTAEKHDAFFDSMSGIEKFKGSALVQQEPDASSFPSGGIRQTFEARGYTAWDPSSPMFKWGTTLCIPTIFVSYTGESLDVKAPLLKALEAVDKAATKVCKYFDRNITKVSGSLGCEQEYFVIDKALFNARPDLVMCGRTVFGHPPARGQQLDDHYFGSIPRRAIAFMEEFELECHKLGIPVTTRHNEVAPSQFEVAPLFEEVNVATDHSMLMMDVMRRIADRHELAVLFHEKPFAEINGTGKHNNWSLITNTGINLFQPRSSARENLLFLTFFVNTIAAVHKYADILRASIATAGNDFRLGANEAPPAIISVFIGSQLSAVLDELESHGNVKIEKGDNMYMKLGIDKIPEIILDNTDRNRTSPFAFTGNKFEFRAVGGNANVGIPMTVLNTIVAKQLNDFKDEVDTLIAKGKEKRLAIIDVLRKFIEESKDVRFEGDNYSEDWVKEAEKRGLPNVKDTPEALDAFLTDKSKEVFGCYNVLSERELEARNEILLENYIMKVQIESRVISDLALNHVIPTAVKYQMKLIDAAKGLKEIGLDNSSTVNVISKVSEHIDGVKNGALDMIEERKRVNKTEDGREKA
ncbi:MAG: glutamine synthetase III, partial [Cyclobacteriaceae bacterium]|nr:glutamine synthetase III [Cyclobacteriaceae bacterium]